MTERGWKVVSKNANGTFGSAVAGGDWCCSYTVNKRTKGYLNTPVLAFRTRQNARRFRFSYVAGGHIFKARLENARPQSTISFADTFTSFWAGSERFIAVAPEGTLACDAITLLEPA